MTLSTVLIAHGSALILPMSVIEGPVVSIVTGFLTSQGYFDGSLALLLLVCGDLVGDLIYYWIGRTGRFLHRRAGLRGSLTPDFQQHLLRNASRMLIIGKWTHTIGLLVLVGSGLLRLPLLRFMLINLLATIPKSAALFGFGYFAGDHYQLLERHYMLGTGMACAAGLASLALVLRRTDRMAADRRRPGSDRARR